MIYKYLNINWSVYRNWKLWVSLPFMLVLLLLLLSLKALSLVLSKANEMVELILNSDTPEWVNLWEDWLNNK